MNVPAPSWISCQLGAREHYAIPRALFQHGRLHRLLTDAWRPARPPLSWVVRGGGLRRLEERVHPDLLGATVKAFTTSLLAFEITRRGLGGWEKTMARNRWFEKQVVRALAAEKMVAGQPVLFAYSYAALEILRHARARGWRTVLGQIDPGPVEEEIVREEFAREPTLRQHWQPAPTAYWERWREELALADTVAVNSRWSFDAMRRLDVPTRKLRILPLAYESPSGPIPPAKEYPDSFTAQRPLRVLFLGQINLRKGVARLLRAAARLPASVEIWMVGSRQIADDPALTGSPRVRWLGPCTRGEAAAYYRQCDVFLLPTLSDGFALTQLEAMAHRMPVIASAHCGDVVRDGIDGLILSEPTPEEIERTLLFCVEHPRQLAAFSHAAGLREEFSLAALGKNLLALEGQSSTELPQLDR